MTNQHDQIIEEIFDNILIPNKQLIKNDDNTYQFILDGKKIKVDIAKHYDSRGIFIEFITFYYTIKNENYKKNNKYLNCLKTFDISYHIILENCIKSPNYIVENAKKLEEKVDSMV